MKIKGPPFTLFREGARFALVGILNVVVSFIVFHFCYVEWQIGDRLLDSMGSTGELLVRAIGRFGVTSVNASLSTCVGYAAGVLNSFFLNSRWTFGVTKLSHKQFVRFCIVNLIGMILSSLAMFYFVDIYAQPYLISWLLVTGFVMVLNFSGSKYWAFANAQ